VCKGLQGKRGEQQATNEMIERSVQLLRFPVYFGDAKKMEKKSLEKKKIYLCTDVTATPSSRCKKNVEK